MKLKQKLNKLNIETKVPVSIHLLEEVPQTSIKKMNLVRSSFYNTNRMVCTTYFKPIF